MEQRNVGIGALRQRDLIHWSACGRSVRHVLNGLIWLGLLNGVLPAVSAGAQVRGRLTVRPREMATGTQNPKAGEYPLEAVPEAMVYVPSQCVGAKRCPLFAYLPHDPIRGFIAWIRPVADKYGMILLSSPEQPEKVDAALKEILQRFAIDPDKIAIIGRCGSGGQLLFHNFDVFSRIIAVSSEIHGKGGSGQKLPPPDKDRPVEFLLDAGISETRYNFVAMRDLRAAGYRVKQIMGLRGHEHQWEDYDYVGRWLQESWAKPNPATRAAPQVVADPLPILTTEALTKMTNFWLSFQQEPYEIRMTARREYLREVAVPVGPERSSIILVNMAAFASKYPSVAAKLKAAGLTGQQHDAYRVALISAIVTHNDSSVLGPVDPASVMAKNVAFMEAHPSEFTALDTAGILYPNKVREIVILHPDMVKDKGPLGIWRTP